MNLTINWNRVWASVLALLIPLALFCFLTYTGGVKSALSVLGLIGGFIVVTVAFGCLMTFLAQHAAWGYGILAGGCMG